MMTIIPWLHHLVSESFSLKLRYIAFLINLILIISATCNSKHPDYEMVQLFEVVEHLFC